MREARIILGRSIEEWTETLRAPEVYKRRGAARALAHGGLHATLAAKELAQALKDSDQAVRREAARALKTIGEPARKFLEEIAKEGPTPAKEYAVLLLANREKSYPDGEVSERRASSF